MTTSIKDKNKAGATQQKTLITIEDDTLFRFENIGDTIKGVLSEIGQSEKWRVGLYTIDTEKGSIRILGKTQLDRLMKKVDIGDYIEIEYIDDQKTPNGNMKIFDVRTQQKE